MASQESWIKALQQGTGFTFEVREDQQNVQLIDKTYGCVYKLVRTEMYQRRWYFQLHLAARMFNASGGPSEVLRILRDQQSGTIELIGQDGSMPSTSLHWEGFRDEGGLATASRRFRFTFDGEEYVWQRHRRFAGDNLSCTHVASGRALAYYTNKLMRRKLQGILVIEGEVQDPRLLHTLVAGCLSYREWLERRDMLVWGDYWFSQSVSC